MRRGGGLSNPDVFERAWSALKPGGRLVANAVSIQSEARLIEQFESAAPGALAIVAVGLIPVLMLHQAVAGGRAGQRGR